MFQKLDSIFSEHDGPDRVEFELRVGQKVRVVNRKHRVEWDEILAAALAKPSGMRAIQRE